MSNLCSRLSGRRSFLERSRHISNAENQSVCFGLSNFIGEKTMLVIIDLAAIESEVGLVDNSEYDS